MKTQVKLLLGVSIIFLTTTGWAQEKTEQKERDFQLTFITPLGTNGVESKNIINKFSINIIAGYSGGLQGTEFGGVANILKGDMKGAQFAGYANINLAKGKGFQGAGVLNFNHKEFRGSQFAGGANVILSDAKAFQASGFANVVNGKLKGHQFAGFANVVTDSLRGFQGAGFGNYSMGNSRGQVSGFTNFNVGEIKGPQITGFSNINMGDIKGVQLAGFANISTDRLQGVQISGFFNYAKKLKGFQLGVFNYIDSLESGVSVGVISFIRNGYHTFEVSGNESLNGVISYKTGTRSFYNILAVGASGRNEMIYWGWGYGIGTILPISKRVDLNFEGTCFQINENKWYNDHINLLNKVSISLLINVTDNFTIFAGPTWNVMVSDIGQNSKFVPWHTFNKTYDNDINVKMYPGFNVGMRF
ncbi:MAG: hypothetical protein EHM93_05645 [Bacteroidales bacterium]|nr:MAG: hypothetical protein EHM93_05645 [Bacteroidales bacterium]